MACPAINLRNLLLSSQAGGSWTYNGFKAVYDGDPDNLAQFNGTPASPPEELAALAGDDPTVDPDGHTVGFYSLTYEVIDAGCTAENNVVLPLAESYFAGVGTLKSACNGDESVYQLFNLISNFGSLPVDTNGAWTQVGGTPNPHPGFYNPVDPTLATFDASTINHPSHQPAWRFRYSVAPDTVEGFEHYDCLQCEPDSADVRITYFISMNEDGCCPSSGLCYSFNVDDGVSIHAILLQAGSITNVNPPMDFPYVFPADREDFAQDLTNYLANNGGGSCEALPVPFQNSSIVYIDNPCVAPASACTVGTCETTITINAVGCR